MAAMTSSGISASGRRTSRRPLALAMVVSIALHCAIVLGVPGRLDVERAESPATPTLAVIIADRGDDRSPLAASDGVDDPQAAGVPAETLPSDPGPAPEHSPERSPAPAGRGEPEPGPETAVAGVPAPEAFATVAEPVSDSDDSDPTTAAPSTTAIPAEAPVVAAAVPAAVYTTAITKRDETMLANKLLDWGAAFDSRFSANEELTWKHKGQRYAARFRSIPGGDDTRLDRLAIEISTEEDGHRLSTVVRMKRLAFSNYAQFVNRWDDAVQIHDDELDGRFHSNSMINLSYSRKAHPRFHGKVTTAARRINITDAIGRRRRDEIFMGGVETGVRSIRLPKDFVPLPSTLDIRDDQVLEFDEDARITFHADGSFSWVFVESGLFERRGTIRSPATYLVATGKAELDIQGTVRGKVLVYSPRRIVISGDLVYATSPAGDRDLDDYIGIVSEGSVDIAEPAVTGPGDLTVHGAIYARRLFRVRDYRRRGNGTLWLFGSLTAGSLTATEPRFATRIDFDPRLEERRPPGFPVTDRYEVEDWDRVWTVAAASPADADAAASQRANDAELLR